MKVVNRKEMLDEQILNNLLTAQKKMAENIDHEKVKEFIRLSKFISKKVDVLRNQTVNFFPEK